MEYHWLRIIHIIAAVVAVGPLALAPWLAAQVVSGMECYCAQATTWHPDTNRLGRIDPAADAAAPQFWLTYANHKDGNLKQ